MFPFSLALASFRLIRAESERISFFTLWLEESTLLNIVDLIIGDESKLCDIKIHEFKPLNLKNNLDFKKRHRYTIIGVLQKWLIPIIFSLFFPAARTVSEDRVHRFRLSQTLALIDCHLHALLRLLFKFYSAHIQWQKC